MRAMATSMVAAGVWLHVFSAEAADVAMPIAPQAPAAEVNGWQFSVTPYGWAAGLSGNVGLFRAPAVHVSADFGDVLNHLDFALMAAGEARYGRFSLFADAMYMRVSVEATTRSGVIANRVTLTSTTANVLLGAGYAVWQDEKGQLDLAFGVRTWNTGGKLSFAGGVLDGARFNDTGIWADAMVGLRGRYAPSESFYLTGWGLIGKGSAKLDWDVGAGLGYRISDRVSAVVGYRALGVDYERDGAVFDVVQHGPTVSLSMRF